MANFDKAIKLNPKNRDLFLEKAYMLEKNNKFVDASITYSKWLSSNKDDGEFYYKRAMAYRKINRKIDAEKDLKKAQSLGVNIDEADVVEDSSVMEQLKSSATHVVEQPVQKTDEKPEPKEDNTNPLESEKYLNRGNINFKNLKYPEAIEDLTKAIQLNLKDIRCYLLRAEVYEKMNKFQEAMQDLTKVTELSPNSILAYVRMGNIFKQQNDFAKGEFYYKKAMEINPRNANSYFGYAQLCENNGKKELAIANYQQAAKFDIKLSKECNIKIAELKA